MPNNNSEQFWTWSNTATLPTTLVPGWVIGTDTVSVTAAVSHIVGVMEYLVHTDLCTPWKGFQYSENKFPYSAIIFRSVIFLVAPPIAKKQTKKNKQIGAAYRRDR